MTSKHPGVEGKGKPLRLYLPREFPDLRMIRTKYINARSDNPAQAEANATDTKCKRIATRLPHRVAHWNVRGLLEQGKLSIVEREMERHQVAILGLSETHLRQSGHYETTEGNTIYCSGNGEQSSNGVAVIIHKKYNNCVLGYKPINDRIMTIKINCKPIVINIVQVYAPTAQSLECDIDSFYEVLEDTINGLPRREMLIVQGDWNAKIGDSRYDDHIRNVVGRYGLGIRNERGERFLEFCIGNRLTVTNTCFKNHPRRLYTWKSPGDRYRNQIDFITIDQRWRSSVINSKTFPGADCNSDHKLVVATIRIRFKHPKKREKGPLRLRKIESEIFKNITEKAFLETPQEQQADIEHQWQNLKVEMLKAVEAIARQRKPQQKSTERILWKVI
ncbi:hypothetical protein ABMA28_000290 [Loxostege sticticalis]|uniref:Endonuclease/exonuclease/phosphatase domain-containing protein n=1 Tax=Loxostege sticticalis TaxID=481309 RepID=A0ABD0TRP3_LOXSC